MLLSDWRKFCLSMMLTTYQHSTIGLNRLISMMKFHIDISKCPYHEMFFGFLVYHLVTALMYLNEKDVHRADIQKKMKT